MAENRRPAAAGVAVAVDTPLAGSSPVSVDDCYPSARETRQHFHRRLPRDHGTHRQP